MDLEIRGLQAGDGRRGSNASQSNGCCFDATISQQFLAMGTEQAVQQISAMYRQFSKSFETQRQTAPVTPVHVSQRKIGDEGGEENEEEQRKSASGVTQVKAMEKSSTHQEKEMEVVAERLVESNMEMNAGTHRRDPVHLGNSNSSSRLKEKWCREEETESGKEESKEKAARRKDPRALQ